jgi:hypothetical protein
LFYTSASGQDGFLAISHSYHFGFEHFPVGPGRAVVLVYGEAAYRACLGSPLGLHRYAIVGLPAFWPADEDGALAPLLRKLASRAVVVWAESGAEGLRRALRHAEMSAVQGARAVGVFNPGFQPDRPSGVAAEVAVQVAGVLHDAHARALPAQGRLVGRAVLPWTAPVDAAAMFGALRAFIGRHLAEADEALDTIALWCLHTWCALDFNLSPRLVLQANDARADHAQALRLIGWLTPSPLLVSRAIAAHLLPAIAAEQPTLLIDDVAGGMLYRRDMRALLAAGAHPDGTFLSQRTKRNPAGTIACFCPAAIATTVVLPDDLRARSVVVPMVPAPAGRARAALGDPPAEVLALRAQMQAFAASIETLPEGGVARATWQPLLSLAALIGTPIAERAAGAMVRLSRAAPPPASNLALLADIRAIFGVDPAAARIPTAQMIDKLAGDPELAWASARRGRKIDARDLAERLAHFGVRPVSLRMPDGAIVRGYRGDDLAEAFARYLPDSSAATNGGNVAAA